MLGGVTQPVLDDTCGVGAVGSLPELAASIKDSGVLQAWADRIATGFIDVANTAQGLIGVLQQLAPAVELAAKAFAMFKLAQSAGGLTGIVVKGEQAASVMKQLATASLPAKAGRPSADSRSTRLLPACLQSRDRETERIGGA